MNHPSRSTLSAAVGWALLIGCTASGGGGPVADAGGAADVAASDVPDLHVKLTDVPVFVDVSVVIDPDMPLVDVPVPLDASAGDATARDAAAAGDGGALPNLIPIIQNTQIQERTFGASACEVMEGCTVVGSRRLLRFDLLTPNIGEADLYFGAPNAAGRPPGMFEFGTCHMHWHLRGYADYRLFDMAGVEVGRGHKQSYCLLDTARYMGMSTDLPATSRYNCGNQGIHAGWYDLYGRSLDCQYVDITDVPPGTYRLRAQVNGERVVVESRYDDNEASLTVVIPPRPVGPDGGLLNDPTLACGGADEGLDRDCGWTVEGVPRTCTPGARVNIGCNAGCVPPIGVCAGDPMLRICAGDRPCMRGDQLAANDDSCAGGVDGGPDTHLCSNVTFTCPAGGRYTILSGAFRAGGAYECHFDIR
ncbi:MAG: Lysyl oxidase [Myxococcaceae bacterium]|nr:Lysyl oxidase [Myxococcaceae bacterium]